MSVFVEAQLHNNITALQVGDAIYSTFSSEEPAQPNQQQIKSDIDSKLYNSDDLKPKRVMEMDKNNSFDMTSSSAEDERKESVARM